VAHHQRRSRRIARVGQRTERQVLEDAGCDHQQALASEAIRGGAEQQAAEAAGGVHRAGVRRRRGRGERVPDRPRGGLDLRPGRQPVRGQLVRPTTQR
jgi:hypothetical protein